MNPTARDLGSSFGAHVFLWASDSSPWELDRAIASAASLALDFVQVSLSSLAVDLPALGDSLQRHGMPCLTGLAVPPDVWAQRRGGGLLRYLKDAIDATAALGSGILSGALYTPMGEKSDPAERGDELRLIRGELKEAAQYASERRIQLGLEPLNRYETSLINTCEQVLGFIADIDEPNLFVHLDTFHMNIEEGDLYGAITLARDRLGYVQLAESDRGLPGKGHVPWEAVFAGLRDADFAGPLAFESFTTENVVLARAACLWRDVVGDPNAFVTEGRAAMRSVAEKVGYRFPA